MSRTGLLQLLAHFGALVSHSVLANPENLRQNFVFNDDEIMPYYQINSLQANRVLSDGYSTVRDLKISRSDIIDIRVDFICKLTNLIKFTITSSNIRTLPAGFFIYSKNLLYVFLASNEFTPQPGVFNGLVSILYINLSRNYIKNLHHDVFRYLRTLRKLDLSYNNITELQRDIFMDLIGLEELALNDNELTYIPKGLFSSTTELEILDLSNNYFYFINKADFKFLRKLEYLNMENNNLTSIHKDAFVNNENLKIVNFAFNYLSMLSCVRNISGPLSPLRYNLHLEEIYLARNFITEILSDWHDLPNLRILDLSDNHINNLKFEDLQFKARNVIVDLELNKLKTVNLTTLECFTYNSTSNDIPKITVQLRFNPFECTCDSFLRYLNGAIRTEVYDNVKLDAGYRTCFKSKSSCTFRNDTCINN